MKKRFSRRSSRRKGERKVTSGFFRYPAPIVIPLNQAIRVQMRNLITVTSSVGGIISGMIPCDPSATLAAPFAVGAMFNEWSSWAALFFSY